MTILLRQKPLPQVVRQIVQRDNGAWFDPEDMSTMFQDAAGTTPVTALEQPVGRWLDKSGNGNHAAQSITTSRPTLSARYNQLTNTQPTDYPSQSGSVVTQIPNALFGGNVLYIHSDYWVGLIYFPSMFVTQHLLSGVTYTYSLLSTKPTPMDMYPYDYFWYINSTVVDFDGEYYRHYVSFTPPEAAEFNPHFRMAGGYKVGAFMLNTGATPLPYQRVNTKTDYDSVGWPRYLRGDGIDDFYNLPFMNLYGNGSCSIVAARDAVSQATDTYVISERSTTDADPKYFPSRQLANGGNMNSYIVSDEGTVRLDTIGSAFGGAKLAAIRSVVDSGSNIKLFKDGAVVADDNYTRTGTLTLNNTTIDASVSTTTSNYANMRLYGLIITKSALSDTDRRRCEQFLASRLTSLGVTLS